MESLAIIVAIIFMIALLGGPISYVLTYIPGETLLAKIFRRIPILIITFMSMIVCTQLIFAAIPIMGKTVGIFGLVTDYFAIRREFFPDFYLRNYLKGKTGDIINPIISAIGLNLRRIANCLAIMPERRTT